MVRSFRGRLLLASMAIAVAAVAATAWLISRNTADRLRDDVERSLERDGMIYDRLWSYGTENSSWDGVDDLVADLAEETGQRIALATRSGALIVDSAQLEGHTDVALPRRPAAIIDPNNPVLFFGGELDSDIDTTEFEEYLGAVDSSVPPPSFTPEELTERRRLAEAASACLDAAGVAYSVSYYDGIPSVDLTADEPTEAEIDALEICVNTTALYAPSAAELAALEEEEASMVDVGPAAPPARLYLGERGAAGLALLDVGSGPTLVAAGSVALLAVVLTVGFARRILRPVAALTSAVRRMESGDLEARVPARGDDELAGLAHAFNTMADRRVEDEEQRRRLVTDLAHELRTPLGNVLGYLEAAQDGVMPVTDELVGSLHEEAMLLQRLVDDLQTLSLAEAGRLALHLEPVDVAGLAESVAKAHRARAAAEGLTLQVNAAPGPGPLVEADPERLRQALGNLVSNALRHTPKGGDVTLRVRVEDEAVVVEVQDTGEGIDPEHLPRVFDRFWRADASRSRGTGGSGLGLAICNRLVDSHGGSVTATSTPGNGSTFTVTLPRLATAGAPDVDPRPTSG